VYGDKRGFFPVYLAAGKTTVRFVMGGWGTSSSQVLLQPIRCSKGLYLLPNDAMTPDAVDGQLAGDYMSVVVANAGEEDVFAESTVTVENEELGLKQTQKGESKRVVRGVPTEFVVDVSHLRLDERLRDRWDATKLHLSISSKSDNSSVSHTFTFQSRTFTQPYRFTFKDVDNSVHFASIYPPKESCPESGCPVLFTTHGASVEADSPAWTFAYRQKRAAYILFPTNRRRFGYDWETSGYVNGLQALAYFGRSLPGVPKHKKEFLKVDITRRLYAGHSMGGHGCWVYATHEPDYALAAVPASGWIRHELYLPSYLRYDYGYVDHFLRSILLSAVQEYDADVLAGNLKGIPVAVRYGGADSTVPPYLMRRMARIVNEVNQDAEFVTVSEVRGEGHWWDQVVDDDTLSAYFDRYLYHQQNASLPAPRPPLPLTFSLTAINPANMHTRGGVRIQQQVHTQRLSSITVTRQPDQHWVLRTHNVQRFSIHRLDGVPFPTQGVTVDDNLYIGQQIEWPKTFCKRNTRWRLCEEGWEKTERAPDTYGPARRVSWISKLETYLFIT
jgi:pimeloyl-ACP methyl ester carboxylesterase